MAELLSLGVMRAPQILLAVTVLLFGGFLASPAFVYPDRSDGTLVMEPGFLIVATYAFFTATRIAEMSFLEAVTIIGLLVANLAFVILPFVVLVGLFRRRALRYTFCAFFAFGLLLMTLIIWRVESAAFGLYLWLLATVAASGYCLLPRSYDTLVSTKVRS